MKYLHRKAVLLERLLMKIKRYVASRAVHIPARNQKRPWGETSRLKRYLLKRNCAINEKFNAGVAIEALADEYYLSCQTIRSIVCAKEKETIMDYRCTLTNAQHFAKNHMLEEWIHAYLQSDGHNEAFSHGLKRLDRYFIGPVKMPLSLFTRCSGPEEDMKYRVHPDWFHAHVQQLEDEIKKEADMPPLIVHYMISGGGKGGIFELNDGNHRLEAYRRLGIREYYVVVWTTKKREYKQFVRRFKRYLPLSV